MILASARVLQAKIKEAGLHCIVPLGHGPDGYFCRIFTDKGTKDLASVRDWVKYRRASMKRRAKALADYELLMTQMRRPRSPIELMIDRACGLS